MDGGACAILTASRYALVKIPGPRADDPSMGFFGERPRDDGPQRRRHGRVVCQEVACSLGLVLDLSASGMRAEAKGRIDAEVGEVFMVTLDCLGESVGLPAKLVWKMRTGLWRHEVGLEFGTLTDEQRKRIATLARAAASNETVRITNLRRAS